MTKHRNGHNIAVDLVTISPKFLKILAILCPFHSWSQYRRQFGHNIAGILWPIYIWSQYRRRFGHNIAKILKKTGDIVTKHMFGHNIAVNLVRISPKFLRKLAILWPILCLVRISPTIWSQYRQNSWKNWRYCDQKHTWSQYRHRFGQNIAHTKNAAIFWPAILWPTTWCACISAIDLSGEVVPF